MQAYIGCSRSLSYQSPLGLDEGSVLAVHLVVQAAGIAQVVAIPVPAPQRGGGGSAVDALSTLWKWNGKTNKQLYKLRKIETSDSYKFVFYEEEFLRSLSSKRRGGRRISGLHGNHQRCMWKIDGARNR